MDAGMSEALRSMALGTTFVGSNGISISSKDFCTARQLLEHVDAHTKIDNCDKITEYLWELTLKLRIQASDVNEVRST